MTIRTKLEIGGFVAFGLALFGFAFWLGGLDNRVSSHSTDIRELRANLTLGGVKTRKYMADALVDMHNRKQFQFMTPSVQSWNAKVEVYPQSRDPRTGLPVSIETFRWQKITDDKVEEFGRQLIDRGFSQGWRRYPYEGQGRYRDVGWWWVVTVADSFEVDQFVKFYSGYWGTIEIYLEEFDANGDVMPEKIMPHPNLPANRPNASLTKSK
jgi:hypothetical protein